MGYRQVAIKGVGWLGLFRVVTRLVVLLKTAVLARLLTPVDFGRFGIVVLALAFFETMTETGVNQALIYSDRSVEEMLDSAWVVAIARGLLIAGLIAVVAVPLSWFFDDPAVVNLVMLVALVPLVKGFINPMIVEFLKELRFFQEVKFRTILLMVETVVAVVTAYVTRSAIAFVLALLASAIVEVVLSFWWFSLRPALRFKLEHLREILGYGKWVTLSGMAHWVASQLDDLVAGRLFGTGVLGIYQAAYKISTLPVTEISGTVNQVAFPVLAKVKRNKQRLMKIFKKSVGVSGVLGIGLAMILLVFPRRVVMLLLGNQWLEVVALIPYLAIFGLIRSLESALQPLFLAIGQPQVAWWGNLLKTLILILGLVIWSSKGITGVALAVVVSGTAVIPYYGWQLKRLMVDR